MSDTSQVQWQQRIAAHAAGMQDHSQTYSLKQKGSCDLAFYNNNKASTGIFALGLVGDADRPEEYVPVSAADLAFRSEWFKMLASNGQGTQGACAEGGISLLQVPVKFHNQCCSVWWRPFTWGSCSCLPLPLNPYGGLQMLCK